MKKHIYSLALLLSIIISGSVSACSRRKMNDERTKYNSVLVRFKNKSEFLSFFKHNIDLNDPIELKDIEGYSEDPESLIYANFDFQGSNLTFKEIWSLFHSYPKHKIVDYYKKDTKIMNDKESEEALNNYTYPNQNFFDDNMHDEEDEEDNDSNYQVVHIPNNFSLLLIVDSNENMNDEEDNNDE